MNVYKQKRILGSVLVVVALLAASFYLWRIWFPGNPYVSGNFLPVTGTQANNLPVEGKLPEGLQGTYFRNGENAVYHAKEEPIPEGEGMIHALKFSGGQVSYQNRQIETEELKAARLVPKDQPDTVRKEITRKNPANALVTWLLGHLIAYRSGREPYEINPRDLSTLGRYTFDGQFPYALGGRPKLDLESNKWFVLGSKGIEPIFHLGIFNSAGRLSEDRPLDLDGFFWMSDFALTKRFIIIPKQYLNRAMNASREWGSKIALVPRDKKKGGQDIQWFATDFCLLNNLILAEDRDSELITLSVTKCPEQIPEIREHKLDLKNQKSFVRTVFPNATFAVINRGISAANSHFIYFGQTDLHLYRTKNLVKFNFRSEKIEASYDFGKRSFGGEAIFIPDPAGKDEDSGWLLEYVYDEWYDQTEALLFDAKNLQVLAKIKLPQRVPYGLNGVWVPAELSH